MRLLVLKAAEFLSSVNGTLGKGPLALVFGEDEVEIDGTVDMCHRRGFAKTLLFARPDLQAEVQDDPRLIRVAWSPANDIPWHDVVTAIIAAAPGAWIHYTFNAEFLFYPFCESRSVGELITFAMEERRDSILTYVVDLYARDLRHAPLGVSIEDTWLDRAGYYAQRRKDRWNNPLDRQMDFFGGLKWRFEEHVPEDKRRIDRVGLFRAAPGLAMRADHTLSEAEWNTYACPWHNSPTAAICSFRTAKALMRNPGSSHAMEGFHWYGSDRFRWRSQQLLDL
ncbi:MAG: hypothetical protein ACU0DW_06825, partial [Shimia sp.]